jgi:hypothetical protein
MSARRTRWVLGLLLGASIALVARLAAGAAGVGDLVALLLPVSFLAVGGFVAWRRPGNPEAWLLTGTGTAWALALSVPYDGGWIVPVSLMAVHLPLRFPDGRLPSTRWRVFSWLAVALPLPLAFLVTVGSAVTTDNEPNPYYVAGLTGLTPLLALVPLAMLASVVSLVLRYRRSDSMQRHQIRWLAWAGGWIVTLYSITLVTSLAYDAAHGTDSSQANWFAGYPAWLTALQLLALMSFLLIPLTIGIAILRYRLYDIDRIISRTAAYTLVTVAVAATYAVVVGLASRLLPERSAVSVALATLVAAALARPLLHRVQATVDRRFNRSRYDALHTVETFAAGLRHTIDPHEVAADLVARVQTALEPSAVRLWLVRPPEVP